MKIESLTLVYFSPTGTTRKIVETIARGINYSSIKAVDITQPAGRKRQLQTSGNELLIVGVPVYFGRIQTDAAQWLQTLKADGTPAVCVVVYGNREYDDALLELKSVVLEKGGLPIACAAFIGEHSFSSPETPIAEGRPDADDINLAELFGAKIRDKMLSSPSVNHITDITVPGNHPYIDMIDSKKRLSAVDFIAVDENCSRCGVCSRHCPVGAIDPENSASIDVKRCILCSACVKSCPESARTVKNEMIRNVALRLSQACQGRKEPVCFL